MAILEVKNISKVYSTRFGSAKVQALTNMNFSVEEGEYVAIMGESGSGKTTLLNILASLDRPTGGEVMLNGKTWRGSGRRSCRRSGVTTWDLCFRTLTCWITFR